MSANLLAGELAPGTILRRDAGGPLKVGRRLAKGGQGFVYEIAKEPSLIFKQIRPEPLIKHPDLPQRMATMIANQPARWRETTGHVNLTWPLDTVLDGPRFIGFVMPRIDMAAAAEIHSVSNPSDRHYPTTPGWIKEFTWRYHVQVASNLALVTDVLHQDGYVIGDFNDCNILVTPQARVTLVDCDSMQVPNPAGRDFLCEVGRAEFKAPELDKIDVRTTPRESSSDLFPLAVHIHQLLLDNNYPFDGDWTGKGDKPSRNALAADGVYVHSKDRRLVPHRAMMGFDLLPRDLQDLFRRAFVTGARDPALRPTGREWCAAIDAMARSLVECRRKRPHVYAGHHSTCPWCAREAATAPVQKPLPMARPAVANPFSGAGPRPVVALPRPTPRVTTPGARAPLTAPPRSLVPAPRRTPRARHTSRRVIAWMAVIGIIVAVAVAANAGPDVPNGRSATAGDAATTPAGASTRKSRKSSSKSKSAARRRKRTERRRASSKGSSNSAAARRSRTRATGTQPRSRPPSAPATVRATPRPVPTRATGSPGSKPSSGGSSGSTGGGLTGSAGGGGGGGSGGLSGSAGGGGSSGGGLTGGG